MKENEELRNKIISLRKNNNFMSYRKIAEKLNIGVYYVEKVCQEEALNKNYKTDSV